VKEEEKILLTGSHQVKDGGLHLWDLRTLEAFKKIKWDDKREGHEHSTQVYSAKFANPKKEFIIAGGSEKNMAKIFNADTGKAVAVFSGLNKPCLVTDTSPEGNLALIACADGSIQVKNLIYS
jgi:WD40 repeat protein